MGIPQTKQLRAVLYLRVSTREQAEEGYSLDAQERVLTEHCQRKKYNIVGIYRDEGISAKDIRHRPDMLRMLEDAKHDNFDVIVIWKLTRFSRNMADLMTVCADLDKRNIGLESITEAFDSATPAGRLMRSMLGSVAQFEREVIAENVALGLQERAEQGKRTCSEILGYDICGKDTFVINNKEAEYVRFAFKTYLERKNLTEVAELCRQRGYRGKRGKIPTAYTIQVILTRPQYCGYNPFRGNLYQGDYDPIISVDNYNRVQALLKRQGKLIGRHRYKAFAYIPIK